MSKPIDTIHGNNKNPKLGGRDNRIGDPSRRPAMMMRQSKKTNPQNIDCLRGDAVDKNGSPLSFNEANNQLPSRPDNEQPSTHDDLPPQGDDLSPPCDLEAEKERRRKERASKREARKQEASKIEMLKAASMDKINELKDDLGSAAKFLTNKYSKTTTSDILDVVIIDSDGDQSDKIGTQTISSVSNEDFAQNVSSKTDSITDNISDTKKTETAMDRLRRALKTIKLETKQSNTELSEETNNISQLLEDKRKRTNAITLSMQKILDSHSIETNDHLIILEITDKKYIKLINALQSRIELPLRSGKISSYKARIDYDSAPAAKIGKAFSKKDASKLTDLIANNSVILPPYSAIANEIIDKPKRDNKALDPVRAGLMAAYQQNNSSYRNSL